MSILKAFNYILKLQSRPMTIHNLETDTQYTNVGMAMSNYFRNLRTIEEMTSEGREFVVSKSELDRAGITELKKGFKIIDNNFGVMTIKDVPKDLIILGKIVGYRIRTD